MPSTLGLEKMDYAEKSEDELYELAKQYFAASYADSYGKIEDSYLKSVNSSNVKKDTELQNLESKLLKIDQSLLDEKQKSQYNALKSGLSRSSIKEENLKDIDSAGEKTKNALSTETDSKLSALNRQIENLGEQKLNALKNLDTEHALKLDAKINDLVKQENTAREAVLKYNNSVDEKEANYQKQLQSAYDSAIKAKYDNDKKLMEMAANLGESQVNELKRQEKLDAVKKFIAESGMTATDALEFISKDYLFKRELGTKYFAELEDWLKGKRA